MTDRESLLRSIIESPADDTPRLIFADWLDENGEPDRAAFIRRQCKSRQLYCLDNVHFRQEGRGGTFENKWSASPHRGIKGMLFVFRRILPPPEASSRFNAFIRRGFVQRIECPWQWWLTHSPALFWAAGQTVQCRHDFPEGDGRWFPDDCPLCLGAVGGRVPRPFVATAQPLTAVRLTEMPWAGYGVSHDSVQLGDGETIFKRVQLGENSWRCDRWPGIVFEMPQAERDWQAMQASLNANLYELGWRMAIEQNRRFWEEFAAHSTSGGV